jgi:hypothetical protein
VVTQLKGMWWRNGGNVVAQLKGMWWLSSRECGDSVEGNVVVQ